MADTYKRIREISNKYGGSEDDMEHMISKCLKGQHKTKRLDALSMDVNKYYKTQINQLREETRHNYNNGIMQDPASEYGPLRVNKGTMKKVPEPIQHLLKPEEMNHTFAQGIQQQSVGDVNEIRNFDEYVQKETIDADASQNQLQSQPISLGSQGLHMQSLAT